MKKKTTKIEEPTKQKQKQKHKQNEMNIYLYILYVKFIKTEPFKLHCIINTLQRQRAR